MRQNGMFLTQAALLLPAGSLRAEVQQASFEKSFISQQNRDLLLQALRNQSVKLIHEGRMSMLVCSLCVQTLEVSHHLFSPCVPGALPLVTCLCWSLCVRGSSNEWLTA